MTYNSAWKLANISGSSKIISGRDKDGDETFRSYTPVSRIDAKGYLDLVIKVYFPLPPNFPEGGVISQYLHALEVGSRVKISGPNGQLTYEGDGAFLFLRENVKRTYKSFSFVGGGSGVTPLYQIIQHLLDEPHKQFDMRFLFANRSEADILIREELEELSEKNVLKLCHTLDAPGEKWTGYKGFISELMIDEFFDKARKDHLALICGPPRMASSVKEIFVNKGFAKENIYVF